MVKRADVLPGDGEFESCTRHNNKIKTPLVRKATGKATHESTSLKKTQISASGFCYARSRVCYAVNCKNPASLEESSRALPLVSAKLKIEYATQYLSNLKLNESLLGPNPATLTCKLTKRVFCYPIFALLLNLK